MSADCHTKPGHLMDAAARQSPPPYAAAYPLVDDVIPAEAYAYREALAQQREVAAEVIADIDELNTLRVSA
jgi:hypothetical protein